MKKELPIVTIMGRQNVGKSTLFNTIIKEKKAIIDSFPGLTRDVIAYTVEYKSANFVLNDTPGLDIEDSSQLSRAILDNAMAHLIKSSLIIFLMENPAPTSFDLELAQLTRKLSIPTIVVVNKMDNEKALENMTNFYELGFSSLIPVSALGRFNIKLLLDAVLERLPVKKSAGPRPDFMLAVVGRPNSGKSTLLNSIIGYERSVVSDIPGTTRDSIDETFMFHNKMIQIIDTAGIRKRKHDLDSIEFYSHTRTIDTIRRCDVVIHLVDALQGLTETDKKISDEIIKARKPIIIAVNKWDAVDKDDKTFDEYRDMLRFKFYRTEDFPLISISARDKTRIHKLLTLTMDLFERSSPTIETPRLNRFIEQLQKSRRLPQIGQKYKVLYATQVNVKPPEFLFFVNSKELFRKDVVRYFEKAMQKEFNLLGIPFTIRFEDRRKKS